LKLAPLGDNLTGVIKEKRKEKRKERGGDGRMIAALIVHPGKQVTFSDDFLEREALGFSRSSLVSQI
jgi:hypothetical protein